MAGETQSKATDKGRKNSQLQNLQRQEGGGKRLWNLSEPVQGTTGHHGAKTKGYQRHLHVWCCTTFRGHTIAGQTGHQPQEMM